MDYVALVSSITIIQPTLGHQVRKHYQLLDLLKQRERDGLGGVTMTDVRDAVPKADKAIKKLEDDIIRVAKGDRDKEELLFYNNKEYLLSVDESNATGVVAVV